MVDIALAMLAERTEEATLTSLAGLLPDDLVAPLGMATARIAGGTAFRMSASPDFTMFNRLMGAALDSPLTDDDVDALTTFVRQGGGGPLVLQLPPFAETDETLAVLERRGFRRAGRWAKTMRAIGDPPGAPTDLDVREVGIDEAEQLGAVECVGMEMPEALAPWCARQADAPGWRAYAAYDGDRMVAMGCLFAHEDVGQLAGAATLPDARGRGAQLALMSRRIADARDMGLRWITAETGTETPEIPNPSLHNMLRAGLVLLYERQNWVAGLD